MLLRKNKFRGRRPVFQSCLCYNLLCDFGQVTSSLWFLAVHLESYRIGPHKLQALFSGYSLLFSGIFLVLHWYRLLQKVHKYTGKDQRILWQMHHLVRGTGIRGCYRFWSPQQPLPDAKWWCSLRPFSSSHCTTKPFQFWLHGHGMLWPGSLQFQFLSWSLCEAMGIPQH